MDLMNTNESALRFTKLWKSNQHEILQSELNEAFSELASYREDGGFGSCGAIEETMRDLMWIIDSVKIKGVITDDRRLAMVAYRAAAYAAEVISVGRG